MRILVVNYEFPPVGGGGGNVSANIAKQLVNLGVEVFVFTSHYKNLPLQEKKDGYMIYRVRTIRRRLDRCSVVEMVSWMIISIYPLLKMIRKIKPDIVHIHFAVPGGPLGYIIKKVYKIPYVMTLHGGDVRGFEASIQPNLLFTLLDFLIKLIWRNADGVIAVSKNLQDLAKEQYQVNVHYIPNGVDVNYFLPAKDSRKKDERITIIFVGRITKQKGLKYLLKSIPIVLQMTNIPIQLEIIGDGDLRYENEKLANDLDIKKYVEFRGWLSTEDVLSYLRRADIFILPSIAEAFPTTVTLQAMACGLPIIASNLPDAEKLIQPGENGFLFPIGDSKRLAEYITTLIQNQNLREEMGRKSRQKALEYQWINIAQKYLEFFEKIIKKDEGLIT